MRLLTISNERGRPHYGLWVLTDPHTRKVEVIGRFITCYYHGLDRIEAADNGYRVTKKLYVYKVQVMRSSAEWEDVYLMLENREDPLRVIDTIRSHKIDTELEISAIRVPISNRTDTYVPSIRT